MAWNVREGLIPGSALKPVLREIQPPWIEGLNQLDLLMPGPTFDLALPPERDSSLGCLLEVHQARHSILSCKPRNLSLTVLVNSADKISRNPGVEDARVTGKDVDVKGLLHLGKAGSEASRTIQLI